MLISSAAAVSFFVVLRGGRRERALSEFIFTTPVINWHIWWFFSPFQKRNLIAPRPAVRSSFLLGVQKIPSWLKAMPLLVNAVHSQAVVCVILQDAWGRFASLAIWIYWFLRHQESQGNAVISMNANQVKVDAISFPIFHFFLSDKQNNMQLHPVKPNEPLNSSDYSWKLIINMYVISILKRIKYYSKFYFLFSLVF